MAAEQPIPIYKDLTSLYASLGTATNHAERWSNLADEFVKRYGRPPAFIARAPGRVNLIGEHIDYALFGVFPAAVEPDILIACAPRTGEHQAGHIRAENLDQQYAAQAFAPALHADEWQLDIDKSQLRWESYVKAGYYGVLNHFFPTSSSESDQQPVPLDLLVTGSVPAGSGLSSSAAMVVASTLTFLVANGKLSSMTKGALVQMAMSNETRVGVNSGGMDQAASVMSGPGAALYIEFFPRLHAEPIELPGAAVTSTTSTAPTALRGASFVILNSLVVNNKAASARTQYNLRVLETLAGARALANLLGVSLDADPSRFAPGTQRERVTLREVLGRWLGEGEGSLPADKLKTGLERALADEVDRLKPSVGDSVDLEEMVQLCNLSKAEFEEVYLRWADADAERFELYKRTKHVISEALRVLAFRQTCLASKGDDATLKTLGGLMDASMDSCARLFECSHPRLDALTALARSAGAYGARLTGAGWGGCAVALVREDSVPEFISRIRAGYEGYHGLDDAAFGQAVFATKPSSGACVYEFTE